MTLNEKDKEIIIRASEKWNKKVIRALKKIQNTGFAGLQITEAFLFADYIHSTGPSEVSKYNHYKLTEKGENYLKEHDMLWVETYEGKHFLSTFQTKQLFSL